ncbi:sensor histidine kinase [Amycolatopsis antarctica]|uniref:histidine kinase n=2 Tax=Amycolatopsis antarctica TaxID=1854586 RepID=A0A263D2C2_9PSEU|nr:sensor histidine kinase [Amycolatopsis antarctica]
MFVPYLLLVAVVVPSVVPWGLDMTGSLLAGTVLALVVLFASSLIPAVRVLEGAAVREMLDDPAPGATFGPTGSMRVRLRSSAMFALHVLTGGVVSWLTIALPMAVAFSFGGPISGSIDLGGSVVVVPPGWASAWIPAVLAAGLVGLVYLVAGSGALLRRAAAALLGLPPAERIALLERRTERLAERNRLARELHDSVGHALSVVTLQAGAARRTLHRDPAVAERSLLAIEDSARAALDDLDHVLGLLREEAAGTAPQAGLDQLGALLSATEMAGTVVRAEVSGDFAGVPPVVSREAYRILQECLTNALRHAGRVPVAVRVSAGQRRLDLAVTNPVSGPETGTRGSGGRGLRGMAERVDVLRGDLRAGRANGNWEVAVSLPWGENTGREKTVGENVVEEKAMGERA